MIWMLLIEKRGVGDGSDGFSHFSSRSEMSYWPSPVRVHGDARPLQANLVDHRAELEQRERREIDEQFVEAGNLLARLVLDRNAGDPRRQRIRADVDVLDTDLALQFGGQLLDQHHFISGGAAR